MPIYEYECTTCQHKLEAFQKMSDAPLMECPECNKPTLQKLVSAAGFQLKGTGWYATDFKNKNKAPEAKKTEDKSNPDKKESTDQSSSTTTSSSEVDKK